MRGVRKRTIWAAKERFGRCPQLVLLVFLVGVFGVQRVDLAAVVLALVLIGVHLGLLLVWLGDLEP